MFHFPYFNHCLSMSKTIGLTENIEYNTLADHLCLQLVHFVGRSSIGSIYCLRQPGIFLMFTNPTIRLLARDDGICTSAFLERTKLEKAVLQVW